MKEMVTWATSQSRAEAAMKRADVLLEDQKWSEALDALADAQRELARTVEFVLRSTS